MSSSPTMIMNGTLSFWWLRIFFCIRSEEASTSTRRPFFFAAAANSWRYSTCPSPIGMPTAWTGASHGGMAPA